MVNQAVLNKREFEKAGSDQPAALHSSMGELAIKHVATGKILLSWGVSEVPEKLVAAFFQVNFAELVTVARIYDVTDFYFNGKNAHHTFEIAVPYHNGYWYVNGLNPNRSYMAEIGVQLPGHRFFPIFRSNELPPTSSEKQKNEESPLRIVSEKSYKHNPPKWQEHVSTYSCYGNPENTGEEHE